MKQNWGKHYLQVFDAVSEDEKFLEHYQTMLDTNAVDTIGLKAIAASFYLAGYEQCLRTSKEMEKEKAKE